MLDPDYFNEVIEDIVAETNLIPLNTPVIIDLEDITKKSVNDAIETIGRAYEHMRSLGFTYIISVGSSIPTSVNHAVKTPDSSATIFRKEVLAWKASCRHILQQASTLATMVFVIQERLITLSPLI